MSPSVKNFFPRTSSNINLRTGKHKSKFVLPVISCKLGSLHSFLSIEEFRKGLQAMPDETKFQTEVKTKKVIRKLYLTMNEELSSTSKKETHNTLEGSEDQGDSEDERKKLLYDKHVINRQRAAANICKGIIEEVKAKYGYVDQAEESEKTEKSSDDSENDILNTNKLVKKTAKFQTLSEKFEKISELSQKYFQQTTKSHKIVKKNTNELMPGVPEVEENKSYESSLPRFSRTKDKVSKEDTFMAQGNLYELFAEEPSQIITTKSSVLWTAHSSPFGKIQNPETFFNYLNKNLELVSSRPKAAKAKKSYISINKHCISLPDFRVDFKLCIYISQYFSAFKTLMKADLSNNAIGDLSIAQFVNTIKDCSPVLEILDISATGSGLATAEALGAYLSSSNTKIITLRADQNSFKDEGICSIAVGLLHNLSLQYVNLSNNCIEIASGLAIAKVLRINRVLKGLSISQNSLSGRVLREISRALIVNTELISVNFTGCELNDDDAKELAHMINSNIKLQQLELSQNRITHKGLEYFRYSLVRNKALVHLALSGNTNIKLKGLEKVKENLAKYIEVDIGKEEDFFRSAEAKKYKLIDYIR